MSHADGLAEPLEYTPLASSTLFSSALDTNRDARVEEFSDLDEKLLLRKWLRQ